MIRALEIAGVLICGHKTRDVGCPRCALQRPRPVFFVLCCIFVCFILLGCAEPEEEPIWEKVKIGDLAPSEDGAPKAKFVRSVNLEVHIIEIPFDKIGDLDKIRKRLHIRPLRLKNFQAFSSNSFLARFGKLDMWNDVRAVLSSANAQEVARVSLMLTDEKPQTIAIRGLSRMQTVFYTAEDGSRQGAKVGPGILGLRIKAERVPGRVGICEVTAYPVFSLPTQSAIPQIADHMKRREFSFISAALGSRMSPGDFVFLAPKEYVDDQTALGGLFFSNVRGRLFLDATTHKPPQHKPAVRVFLLTCTRIDI